MPTHELCETEAAGKTAIKTDIVIIGGGPAGSTAAALLAQQGFKVSLLEKATHPRFHIGESLLPANMPLLDKLGVREQVAAIGLEKWGVEFNSFEHDHQSHVEFSEAWDKSMPHSYQVRRADFDHILIRNARTRGADVVEGCRVREVVFTEEHALVKAHLDDGSVQDYVADFVIDASGRDTFLANQLKSKQKNKKHNSSALYGHFTGVERYPGKREGDISIYWFAHGWFWLIPLADGTTSIGAVCWPAYMASRKVSVEQFLLDSIALAPMLAMRMKNATLMSKVEATGNYAYSSSVSHARRCLLLGDAFAFVDPVFSSGVFLAMNSAFIGAETVSTCLREPAKAARALAKFDRHMQNGPAVFSWFIYRVTNPAMRELFLYPRNFLYAKRAVMSVLAGDIFDNRAIWPSVYVFKAVYYISSLANPLRTFHAWQRRKINIQDAQAKQVS
ncbi:MAG: NAD(P)/FAD-dependent oxidoreductase [Pseudomonadota bacterium]